MYFSIYNKILDHNWFSAYRKCSNQRPGRFFNFLRREGALIRRGRFFGGGRLLQILSLRRGANSKRGVYLKLGANSSIYGKQQRLFGTKICSDIVRRQYLFREVNSLQRTYSGSAKTVCTFSRQTEAILFIMGQIFFATRAVLNIGEYLTTIHRSGGGQRWIFTKPRSGEVNIQRQPPTLR